MIDVERALEIVRRRDLHHEGIPMILALHGAAPAPEHSPRRAAGGRLAQQLLQIHAVLRATTAGPRASGVDVALVEAAAGDGALEREARRAVSLEERSLAEAISVLAYAELGAGSGGDDPRPDATPAGTGTRAGTDAGGELLHRTVRALQEGRFVTVINYHNTPASTAKGLRAELAALGRRYGPVGRDEMRRLFAGRDSRESRLPLVPVFYEGYRNNYEHAAPACAHAGLVGWFFLITQFLDTPAAEQLEWARAHHVGVTEEEPARERIAMSWDEAAEIARTQVVTSHTASHRAAHMITAPGELETELVRPAHAIREHTGLPAIAHAWLFGGGIGEPSLRTRLLAQLGYRWVFGNVAIDAVT